MNSVMVACIMWYHVLLGTNKIGYTLTTAFGSQIMIGFILGIVFGDVKQGLLIGATIQLVFLRCYCNWWKCAC